MKFGRLTGQSLFNPKNGAILGNIGLLSAVPSPFLPSQWASG